MALKAIVAKIDDVEEKYRDLYTQKSDGKGGQHWEIQVQDMKTQGDLDRVNQALQRERAHHTETQTKLKEAGDKLTAFGEMTPEQITSMSEKLANFEAAGTPELTKNFEKIVTDRVNAVIDGKVKQATDKLSKQLNDSQTQLSTLSKENGDLKLSNTNRTIADAVRSAAAEAKLLPGAITDAMIRAQGSFSIQEDGKVLTADGKTPSDWIEERKQDAAHWWPVARGAGAHGNDGHGNFNDSDNPWSNKNWNVTKQSSLVRQDPAKAARMAEQAGSKLGATRPPEAA